MNVSMILETPGIYGGNLWVFEHECDAAGVSSEICAYRLISSVNRDHGRAEDRKPQCYIMRIPPIVYRMFCHLLL